MKNKQDYEVPTDAEIGKLVEVVHTFAKDVERVAYAQGTADAVDALVDFDVLTETYNAGYRDGTNAVMANFYETLVLITTAITSSVALDLERQINLFKAIREVAPSWVTETVLNNINESVVKWDELLAVLFSVINYESQDQ